MTSRSPDSSSRSRRVAARPLAVGAICAAALASPTAATTAVLAAPKAPARHAALTVTPPPAAAPPAAAPPAAAPPIAAPPIAAPPIAAPPAAAPPTAAPPIAAPGAEAGPTGPAPVGWRRSTLTDPSRRDPLQPRGERGPRRLPVTLWYPAAREPGEQTAAAPGRRPLVLLSPAFDRPASSLRPLAQELASRGYLVVALDHPGEDGADPDRPVVLATRVADLRFVSETFQRTLGERVDPARIAVLGAGLGGSAAANALLREPAFAAGGALTGAVTGPAATRGVDQPFLVLTEGQSSENGQVRALVVAFLDRHLRRSDRALPRLPETVQLV